MPHLLIIGGPSMDTHRLEKQTVNIAGGAGLYTALAARRSGCKVSMVSPIPYQLPDSLKPLDENLEAWFGPFVTVDKLPHFEIVHEGNKTTYLKCNVGEEERIKLSALPQDLSMYAGVHITPMGKVEQQLTFVDACQARGAKIISSGSFIHLIEENPYMVSTLIERSDVFFLNEEEADSLFGSYDKAFIKPGKLMFITRGGQSAIVIQGDYRTELPAIPAKLLDPTGADDTFCGATLSNLLQGMHPIMAARRAIALASAQIEQIGPAALLLNLGAPDILFDERVRIDENQVSRISHVIKMIPEAEAFNFVSDYYPPIDHPAALDFFFAQTLQQFSFWEANHGRYVFPLIATIDGHECKGSTYLSYAYMRPLEDDPEFYTPIRQAVTTREEALDLFKADDGADPMPALDLHLRKALDYGNDMLSLGLTPQAIIKRSNRSSKPLKTFISILDHIGGYKEDPFRKKTNLLALILKERPEQFLVIPEDEEIQPVIDYHVMRFCLRTGLVEIIDNALREKISDRALVSIEEEWAIRYTCYVAIKKLIEFSGLSMGAVDNIAFNYNRQHCPEMSEPICEKCAIDPACSHRKELFQPVIRTTFY